jgi:hypothetical protein
MSRNVKNIKNSSAPIQKYCKVCHDAGKSESEYRSHFTRETRDPNSKVVCPTLLALECRYCFKNGHTVKYCSVLKEREREAAREAAPRRQAPPKAEVKPKGKSTNKNVFACLDSDSEDEDVAPVKVVEVKEEFPALHTSSLTRTQSVSSNYAAALSRPAAPKPVALPTLSEYGVGCKAQTAKIEAKVEAKVESKVAPWASSMPKASTMNWAAWDSDESDDDEDEEIANAFPESYDPYKPYTMAVAQSGNDGYDSDW